MGLFLGWGVGGLDLLGTYSTVHTRAKYGQEALAMSQTARF